MRCCINRDTEHHTASRQHSGDARHCCEQEGRWWLCAHAHESLAQVGASVRFRSRPRPLLEELLWFACGPGWSAVCARVPANGTTPWCCLGASPLPLLDLHLESMWPRGAQQSASRSQPLGCRCANRAFGMNIKKCLFSSSLFSPWHHRQTKVVPNFLFRKLDLFLLAMGRSHWAFPYLVRRWFWRKQNAP